MKFVIAGGNLKIFGKTIHCLSKIGDEIYFEPLEQSISLKTINSSRSTFVSYSFKKKFFTHFDNDLKSKLNDTLIDDSRFGDDPNEIQSEEQFKCKIPSKCLLTIFKNINNIEKNVEKCTITIKHVLLNNESQTRVYDYDATMMKKVVNDKNEEEIFEIKFLIIMSCKFGLKKTYILSISECENLEAVFNRTSCTNHLTISAKYLNETMNSFSNDIEEVTFLLESNKLTVKNYTETELNDKSKSVVNTQVVFDQDEFQNYDIEKETHITFCLKEFKVCLLFGYSFDLPIDIHYERKGRPIVFNYLYNEYFDVNFTLATLNDDLSIQSNSQVSHLSTQQSILLPNNSLLEKRQPVANSTTKQKNDTVVRFEEPKSQKSNKRTLYDASNSQTYLNDTSDLSTASTQKTGKTSQILTNRSAPNESQQNSEDNLPPSKKLKSLMQSLFDSSMDINQSDENREIKKVTNTSIYVEDTDSEDD